MLRSQQMKRLRNRNYSKHAKHARRRPAHSLRGAICLWGGGGLTCLRAGLDGGRACPSGAWGGGGAHALGQARIYFFERWCMAMYDGSAPHTEEDVKHLYITPAIERGWPAAHIRMEARITDGRFNLRGNLVARERPKKADYLLCPGGRAPIAVVEAKDASHGVSYGLQQAKEYARMMDLRFAYSSNGHGFAEYDFFTGVERTLGMDEFPSEEALVARFADEGAFSPAELAVRETPAYTSAETNTPR